MLKQGTINAQGMGPYFFFSPTPMPAWHTVNAQNHLILVDVNSLSLEFSYVNFWKLKDTHINLLKPIHTSEHHIIYLPWPIHGTTMTGITC